MKDFLIVLFFSIALLTFCIWIAIPQSSEEKIYIKDMQVTSQGIVILSIQEGEEKKESIMILRDSDIKGRIYVGNVRIIKKGYKFSFKSLDF